MDLGELEFKPEDFRNLRPSDLVNEYACEIANRILREKLAKAPEVYAKDITPYSWQWETGLDKDCTHRARLVCIEELK